jgi:hypothetical protein
VGIAATGPQRLHHRNWPVDGVLLLFLLETRVRTGVLTSPRKTVNSERPTSARRSSEQILGLLLVDCAEIIGRKLSAGKATSLKLILNWFSSRPCTIPRVKSRSSRDGIIHLIIARQSVTSAMLPAGLRFLWLRDLSRPCQIARETSNGVPQRARFPCNFLTPDWSGSASGVSPYL